MTSTITFTKTDESPDLSLRSLLPIMAHFMQAAGIDVDTLDISFAGRILHAFPEYVPAGHDIPDGLNELSQMVQAPETVLIKLPNASATTNQLIEAIAELQEAGIPLPDYPSVPANDQEREIRRRYDDVTGSVVNPIMRKGNGVRRITEEVKDAARANPHAMGEWRPESRARILHMEDGDFFHTEASRTLAPDQAGAARIEFVGQDGTVTQLKAGLALGAGDIVDAAVMRRAALQAYLEDAIAQSREQDLLLSLHLKATMLKKTDGVVFGDMVRTYFAPVFKKHAATFETLGIDPNNGLSELKTRLATLDPALAAAIEADLAQCLATRAPLAMANVRTGATHLDAPNMVIADVSLANLARWGGQLQDKGGTYRDTLALLPETTYGLMHQVGIDFFKERGALDPKTMGSVTTVRLQAEGAEEYGSKNTTFEAPADGTIRVVAENGAVLHSHDVAAGDIWRMCRTTDWAARNWAQLAVRYGDESAAPVTFWLDAKRPHDAQLIAKVQDALSPQALQNVRIASPDTAMRQVLEEVSAGRNAVAAAGNLLGDHLTDYFPILEIASSSRMESLVLLQNGGLIGEAGSGGTAPDLLAGIAERNHFLWDDVGTALAVQAGLNHVAAADDNDKARLLADGLGDALKRYIADRRSPTPQGLDTRQSHYYLARYWAEAMAQQSEDAGLARDFTTLSETLAGHETQIMAELGAGHEQPVPFFGRYHPDDAAANDLMRPSPTLNAALA